MTRPRFRSRRFRSAALVAGSLSAAAVAVVALPAAASAATAPTNFWAQGYGGSMWNWGNVAITPQGNTVFAGTTGNGSSPNTVTFGPLSWGPLGTNGCWEDAYFAQAGSATGTPMWMTGTSSSLNTCTEPYTVEPLPDSSLLVASYNRLTIALGNPTARSIDLGFVGKISASGGWDWASSYTFTNYGSYVDPGNGIVGASAIPGGGGASVLVGFAVAGNAETFGATTFPNRSYNWPHIVKVNADGSFGAGLEPTSITGTPFVGTGQYSVPGGFGVIARADGSAVAAGSFLPSGSISFGSTTLNGSGDGDPDYWLAKGTPGGSWDWAVKLEAHGNRGNGWWPTTKQMGTDSAGNIYVVGQFDGTATFKNASGSSPSLTAASGTKGFVAKLSANGVWQWAVALDATGPNNYGIGISTLSDGTSVIASSFTGSITVGSTTLTSDGGRDVLLAAIGPDGTWQWARKDGGANDQNALAVSASGDGRIATQGGMTAPATFGTQTLSSGNAYVANYWMAPIAPTNVKAVGGDREATISWDPLGGGVISYTVTAAPGGASCTVQAPATTCTIKGLTPGVKYTFSVTATTPGGTSPAGTADAIPTGTTPAEQKAAEASPTITVPAARVFQGSTLRTTVNPSVGGTVRVVATLAGRGVCTATKKATKAGRMTVTCTLSPRARAVIARKPTTRLKVTATLTDAAGKKATASRVVIVPRYRVVTPVTG